MHLSIQTYLSTLEFKRRSPLTLKAVQQDLSRFVSWWGQRRQRHFDPALLLENDVLDWRAYLQKEVRAAPATINRGLASLRGYCLWATKAGVMTENITAEVKDVPTTSLAPRGVAKDAVDA